MLGSFSGLLAPCVRLSGSTGMHRDQGLETRHKGRSINPSAFIACKQFKVIVVVAVGAETIVGGG